MRRLGLAAFSLACCASLPAEAQFPPDSLTNLKVFPANIRVPRP